METRQKQIIESYQRVKAFLEAYPAPAPGYGAPKQLLDDVVARLGGHTSDQNSGRRLSRAERQRQQRLMKILREHHLRPIVAIARATLADKPGIDGEGIEKALKMPPSNLAVTKLVAEANGIRDAAGKYESAFVEKGRPADFLAQLRAAIDALEKSVEGRGQLIGRQVGAKAGIGQELRRGRGAVDMLDTVVKVAFEGNDVVLAAWQVAKRVQSLPGGGSTPSIEAAQAPVPPDVKLTAA